MLELGDTQVTDAGIAHLRELRELRALSLSGTQVTDGALAHVSALRSLEVLDLTGTQVTDEGVEGLHQALPNCRIER